MSRRRKRFTIERFQFAIVVLWTLARSVGDDLHALPNVGFFRIVADKRTMTAQHRTLPAALRRQLQQPGHVCGTDVVVSGRHR